MEVGLLAGGPAAVDLEGGAGDEGGLVAGEVEDGGGDLFGAAHAADGLGGRHILVGFLRVGVLGQAAEFGEGAGIL